MMLAEKTTYQVLRVQFPRVHSHYARAASFKARSPNEPLHIPKDTFKIVKRKCFWFIRIPVLDKKLIWLPLKVRDDKVLADIEFSDSRMVERDGRFELHLVVKRDVELNHAYSSVLGADLGERFTATAVLLSGTCKTSPKFYGRNIRGIRRKYAYMRKRLGERKLLKKIRQMKNKEQRVVNDQLHKISRAIVNDAKTHGSVIVLGDLKGIRKHTRGRRFNRIIGNMPYDKLTRYITYKANWDGVPVISTDEAYSSRTCHLCNSEGKRVSQGRFICAACGHEWNADYNGAFNIAKRFSGYTLKNGLSRFTAESVPFLTENASPLLDRTCGCSAESRHELTREALEVIEK